MYCHNCGNPVPEGASYCPKCGTKLVDPETLGSYDALAGESAAEEALWGGGVEAVQGEGEVDEAFGEPVEGVTLDEPADEPAPGETTVVEAQETAYVPRGDPKIYRETAETFERTEVYSTPVADPQPQPDPQPEPSSAPRTQAAPPHPSSYQYQSYGQAAPPPPTYAPEPVRYPRTAGSIVVAILAIALILVSLCPWVAIPQGLAALAGGAQQFLNELNLDGLGSDLSGSLNGLGLDLDFDFNDLGIDLGGLGLGALNLAGGYAPWSMYGLATILDTLTESVVMVPGSVAIVGCWIAAVICLIIGIIGCFMPGGSGFARASALVSVGSALMAIDAFGTWLYAIYADGITSAIIGDWLAELSSDFSSNLDIDSGLGDIPLGNGSPLTLNISILNVTFWIWIAIVLAVVTFVLGIAFRRRSRPA